MKANLFLICLITWGCSLAQYPSIHQEQLQHYNSLSLSPEDYTQTNKLQSSTKPYQNPTRMNCQLDKIVFGWHPYWSNGKEDQYQWNLMSDLSFFSYEVDPNSGNALSTHGWANNAAVDSALAHGLRVNLCVTLFSNHSTFFSNPSYSQTLISNLISLVQSRGAHGVNIDFEGIPASQKTNFTNFMIDLASQMHAAIPGSQVSTVLYAVDWNNVFDIPALDPHIDLYTIMGYAYYYSGSSNAGPTDPLYHFGSTYNYTLSKTVSEYLEKGANPNKLVLGLPYYGYEWPTASSNIPSATSGNGNARTFQQVKNNANSYYSPSNETWEYNSFSTNYTFNDGGIKQTFINQAYDLSERLELINHRNIAGMAIWALGYDYNYLDYWEVIEDNFTNCASHLCIDTLYDMGGPTSNYYDDEDYTYTITADNANHLTLAFDSIDIEASYDYLYVYDGPSTSSPQIPGSPFSGQYGGFNWTSTSNAITFRFTSDGATTGSGWKLTYYCSQDTEAPTSVIVPNNTWKTQDFNVSYMDTDIGLGVDQGFYLVSDFNGSEWLTNSAQGFALDDFNNLSNLWTSQTGVWQVAGGILEQGDETESNTNLWESLDQSNASEYLYEWDALMAGNLNNRRSGLHFFCDDPTLPNRGNSYFVYFRLDSDKCQIYKVTNDVWTLMTDDVVDLNPGTWYNYKVWYDPVSGSIKAFVDDQLVSQWIDSNPIITGNSVSFRTGGCQMAADNFKVYKSRSNNTTISIGNPNAVIRYQNPNPNTPSCQVFSICVDSANLWSLPDHEAFNIDWTEAGPLQPIDGFSVDKDTFFDPTQITGQWMAYSDTHSTTIDYAYAIGDAPGDSNIVTWTSNGLNTIFTASGLNLMVGETYYISVRSTNGAGIVSSHYMSDGQSLLSADGLEEDVISDYVVYPNPVEHNLNLEFSKTLKEPLHIELYSVQGKLLASKSYESGIQNILFNVSDLASGEYHIVMRSKGTQKSLRFIKH